MTCATRYVRARVCASLCLRSCAPLVRALSLSVSFFSRLGQLVQGSLSTPTSSPTTMTCATRYVRARVISPFPCVRVYTCVCACVRVRACAFCSCLACAPLARVSVFVCLLSRLAQLFQGALGPQRRRTMTCATRHVRAREFISVHLLCVSPSLSISCLSRLAQLLQGPFAPSVVAYHYDVRYQVRTCARACWLVRDTCLSLPVFFFSRLRRPRMLLLSLTVSDSICSSRDHRRALRRYTTDIQRDREHAHIQTHLRPTNAHIHRSLLLFSSRPRSPRSRPV